MHATQDEKMKANWNGEFFLNNNAKNRSNLFDVFIHFIIYLKYLKKGNTFKLYIIREIKQDEKGEKMFQEEKKT